MAPSVEYEFRPAFRGDAYEWSPRPPEPADPWTKLARHALVREWKIQVADAASRAVWTLRWEPVNRAGTRGAGLSVSRSPPELQSDDHGGQGDEQTGLALLLEHCRQAGDGVLALPPAAWQVLREGGEAARAVVVATGRPAPQFQLRNLPEPERDLLAPLAGIVCLEARPRPINRATRAFAAWALQSPAAPDWLQRVVPPDRGRALKAFLGKGSLLSGILTRLRQLDETTIRGAIEVEKAVSDLRKLADLAGAGGVRVRLSAQPAGGSFGLRLAAGELLLPADHETSARIASSLGLEPPVSPRSTPQPGTSDRPRGGALSAGPGASWTRHGREFALGLAAIAGAFLIGRLTAPARPSPPTRVPLADSPMPGPATPATTRPPRGKPSAPIVARAFTPSLPLALIEGPSSAGPDLAEPTCTPNGDVLRLEPDRLVIVPCGFQQPREASCVFGSCRQASNPQDDPPETSCGRDGTALVLDSDQKVYRPASPPAFTCPTAWYGVPAASDPRITLPEPATKPRPRPGVAPPATFKQSIRSWGQLIRTNPRALFTVVGYASGAPRPKEGCARADTRVRAALTKVMDALAAEQPSLKPQLTRTPSVRTCAPAPGAAPNPSAANHVYLVRGFVPACSCTETERPTPSRNTIRDPRRR